MPEGWERSPSGHSYPVGVIQTFLQLVLLAPLSLRGAAAAMQLIFQQLFALATPSGEAGRLWILRLGLYELTCPTEQADDWVWLVDHTIQLDSVQCLLVLGVRLRDWEQEARPLQHHDLQAWAREYLGPSLQAKR